MNWTERRRRRARRRLALRVLLGTSLLALALGIIGLRLPAEQLVARQLLLARPPETIWRVLLDLDGLPLWRSDLTSVERLPEVSGRPVWREIGKRGTRIVELAVAEPPRRLVLAATEAGLPTLPTQTVVLVPAGANGRTLVTVTERILVKNPVRRVLWRLLPADGHLGRLLRDLEQRVSGAHREVAATTD